MVQAWFEPRSKTVMPIATQHFGAGKTTLGANVQRAVKHMDIAKFHSGFTEKQRETLIDALYVAFSVKGPSPINFGVVLPSSPLPQLSFQLRKLSTMGLLSLSSLLTRFCPRISLTTTASTLLLHAYLFDGLKELLIRALPPRLSLHTSDLLGRAQRWTLETTIEELQRIAATSPDWKEKEGKYTYGRPLLIHIDEVGELSDRRLVAKFGTDDSLAVYYDFWKLLVPVMEMTGCFVYVSGKGAEFDSMGFGHRPQGSHGPPGNLSRLPLEPFCAEHLRQILDLPSPTTSRKMLFEIFGDHSHISPAELAELCDFLLRESGGIARPLSYSLAWTKNNVGSPEKLRMLLANRVDAELELDEVLRNIPGQAVALLPPLLMPHRDVVRQLVLAQIAGSVFRHSAKLKVGEWEYTVEYLASLLGMSHRYAPDGRSFTLSIPRPFFFTLINLAGFTELEDCRQLLSKLHGWRSYKELKGLQLEVAMQVVTALRLVLGTGGSTSRPLGDLLPELRETAAATILLKWNHNLSLTASFSQRVLPSRHPVYASSFPPPSTDPTIRQDELAQRLAWDHGILLAQGGFVVIKMAAHTASADLVLLAAEEAPGPVVFTFIQCKNVEAGSLSFKSLATELGKCVPTLLALEMLPTLKGRTLRFLFEVVADLPLKEPKQRKEPLPKPEAQEVWYQLAEESTSTSSVATQITRGSYLSFHAAEKEVDQKKGATVWTLTQVQFKIVDSSLPVASEPQKLGSDIELVVVPRAQVVGEVVIKPSTHA